MSLQFNTAYYLTENPDVAAALDAGLIESAKWHFDNFGASEGRNPNATFNTAYYLEANPDVAEAFEAGIINPFDHFLQYGASENRAPNAVLEVVAANFDEADYLAANEDVAAAVESGVFTSGYQHWVMYGQFEETRDEATYNGGTPVSSATDTSGLTEALAEYQAAQQAVDDFEEENAEALAGLGDLQQELDDARDENTDAQLTANIAQAEAYVTDAQAAVDEVDGLAAAVAQLQTEQAEYAEVLQAGAVAGIQLQGRLETYNVLNNTAVTLADSLVTGSENLNVEAFAALTEGAVFVDTDSNDFIVVGEDGQLEAAAGVDATAPGFAELLAAAQDGYEAAQVWASAAEELHAAVTDVLEAEGEVDVDADDFNVGSYVELEDGSLIGDFETDAELTNALFEAQGALVDAQAAVEARQELIAAVGNAETLVEQLEALEADVEAAEEAIEALGFEEPEVVDGTESGTAENDLFLFVGEDGSINRFGAEGNDLLYVGEGFTRTDLASDVDLEATREGSSSELEIFFQQDGNDTVLWIEEVEFAGSATGDFEGNTITLTGVNAEDLVLENGFISIA